MPRRPRLTEAHVRVVHRVVEDAGGLPGVDHFTEAQYDDHLRDFLSESAERPIGVFAYGSLIWKPAFEPQDTFRATALGWQRAFTLRIKRFRGTPERPGLMMQLDTGGACEGVLQTVPAGTEWATLSALWRREMTAWPPGNVPRWIEVEAAGSLRPAIAFTANPESRNYVGQLPFEEVAECLSEACGHWGSGAEYLLQTVTALEAADIHDPALWALQERIAALIEERFPSFPQS